MKYLNCYIFILLMLTSGCDQYGPDSDPHKVHLIAQSELQRSQSWVRLEIVPGLRAQTGFKALATPGAACVIRIDPEFYTHSCLGHEIRHCFEGYWHGDEQIDC
jgi:hypothetical protein